MPSSYRVAGIDVHKKMLAVVVTDVAAGGEWEWERGSREIPRLKRNIELERKELERKQADDVTKHRVTGRSNSGSLPSSRSSRTAAVLAIDCNDFDH